MADGARLSAFISISISTHFVFQAEIKITEAVPGRGSATPRAPALLRVLTELPAAKPRTTYSCGSLVHPCGWCFARLEDEGFFAFCSFPVIVQWKNKKVILLGKNNSCTRFHPQFNAYEGGCGANFGI